MRAGIEAMFWQPLSLLYTAVRLNRKREKEKTGSEREDDASIHRWR